VAPLLARVPTPRQLIADRAYDARKLRNWLAEHGCQAVIPPNPTRKHPHAYDRIKDFRRIATRYDKRADTFLAAVFIAATLIWWLN
jgi:transposase